MKESSRHADIHTLLVNLLQRHNIRRHLHPQRHLFRIRPNAQHHQPFDNVAFNLYLRSAVGAAYNVGILLRSPPTVH